MAPGDRPQSSPPATAPGRRDVLVALHEAEAGGATRAVLRVVPFLEAAGWRFSFWVPGPGELQAELRDSGYRVAGVPRELRYSLDALRAPPGPVRRLSSVPGYLRAFRAWVREQRPALVHANTRLTIPEAILARRAGAATVLHVHEMLLPGPRSATAARLVRLGTDAVVAVSEAAARNLERQGVSAIVVPNGVELPALAPRDRKDGAPLVIGTLATVSKRKGTDLFLVAARELVHEPGARLEFRIVGPAAAGPEALWAERLLDEARRAGVGHRVVTNVAAELAEWDVFVLPSREDPFPLSVLEAMASGLPVVASRVDGIAEQLTETSGILVEPGRAAPIVAALRELIASPDRRSGLGFAARARVEGRFTLDRQAEGLARAYEAALARRRGSDPSDPRSGDPLETVGRAPSRTRENRD